jgi:hypothetical protein
MVPLLRRPLIRSVLPLPHEMTPAWPARGGPLIWLNAAHRSPEDHLGPAAGRAYVRDRNQCLTGCRILIRRGRIFHRERFKSGVKITWNQSDWPPAAKFSEARKRQTVGWRHIEPQCQSAQDQRLLLFCVCTFRHTPALIGRRLTSSPPPVQGIYGD